MSRLASVTSETWPGHIDRMWADDRASRALGMRLVAVGSGRATVTMTMTEHMVNGHGIGHGGLIFALADSAFAFACNSHGPVTVAHSAEIRFRVPVRLGDDLVADAVERTRADRRGVYDVQVRAGDTVVASFTGHATELRTRPEGEDR